MHILLILNKSTNKNAKVIVRLHTKELVSEVSRLLDQKKDADAFDLIVDKAEVHSYIPRGGKPTIRPDFTLVEDILR